MHLEPRGRNAHFPETGKRFQAGVKQFLSAASVNESWLPPVDVNFPSYGSITILGRLDPST